MDRENVDDWRSIHVRGYEHVYEVNPLGWVRRVTAGRGTRAGRRLKGQVGKTGYVVVPLTVGGKMVKVKLHRLVAVAFLGVPPPGKPFVNHIDGDKRNNRPSNLEWVSGSENALHAQRLGLNSPPPRMSGEGHPSAKLTWEVVRRLRRTYRRQPAGVRSDVSLRALAARYGVSRAALTSAIKGGTWNG